eukprot:1183484-Prorocentrum_minimum.AAC.1
MASVDTEAEMALRAKTREELADKAERLLEQSRTLKDRLTKSLADRSQEEGEREDATSREVVVDVRDQPTKPKTSSGLLAILLVLVW